MMAGNEPGSSTGNLASSNCRYFMLGCNYRPSSDLLPGWRSAAAVVSGLMYTRCTSVFSEDGKTQTAHHEEVVPRSVELRWRPP